jgi:hypothetical protein
MVPLRVGQLLDEIADPRFGDVPVSAFIDGQGALGQADARGSLGLR